MIVQSRSIIIVQSAILYNTYFVLLQLLFLFVSSMFLVNNVLAKPLYLENLDGTLGHFEGGDELQHLPVNETPQSREKREAVEGLRELCPGTHRDSSKPASGCVKTWLHCNKLNLTVAVCATQSLGCLPSVARFGFPKCKPVFEWMQITLPNGQRKVLKLNATCECARLPRKE